MARSVCFASKWNLTCHGSRMQNFRVCIPCLHLQASSQLKAAGGCAINVPNIKVFRPAILRWVSGTQHRSSTTNLARVSQHAKWADHRAYLLDSPITTGKGTLPILFLPPFAIRVSDKPMAPILLLQWCINTILSNSPCPKYTHATHMVGPLPYIHPVSGNSMYPNPCFGGLGNAFLPSKHVRLQTQPCQLSCRPICRTSSEAFLWGLRLSRPLRGISHGLHFKSRMNKQK